jgi:hypothetical protein
MASAKPMFILVFLFAAVLANAQSPSGDNGTQQSPPAGAQDQSKRVSDPEQAVPAGSADEAAPASMADALKHKPTSLMSPRATAVFDQRYTHLRRGHDQEIAVLLCPAEPGDCWFKDTTPKHQLVPLSLQMDHAEGFTIRYGAPRHYESKAQGTPSYRGDHRLIFLKVHASEDVSLGEHVLKGTMVFRRAESASAEPEKLDIEVKVTVVDQAKSVAESEWPYIHHPGRVADEVGADALIIVSLVVFLPVLGIMNLIQCHSLTCHD